MNKKILIILVLIIAVASILRLWQLGSIPPSPDWDEAALGYNAYSIMQTGRDEYGKFLPVVLRSFDDYKPALYAYFTIPAIAIFGLNTFAVRLVSAIFGILTVFAAYFLVKELFLNHSAYRLSHVENDTRQPLSHSKNDSPSSLNESRPPELQDNSKVVNRSAFNSFSSEKAVRLIALLSAGLLAISPWHLQFSRVAFESNVGMALNVFGALFFLKGLKKPWFLLISSIFFGLNLYMYQGEKVFTPLLIFALIIIFRKQLLSLPKKYLIAALVLGLTLSLPLISLTLTNKEALARAKGVSVFSETTPLLSENAQRLLEDKKNNDPIGLILDNRRIVFAKSIVSGYISHFDLNWLFITGDLTRHHAPNMGLLYLWELPFLLIGISNLVFGKFDKKTRAFIFAWFLIVPIPASITSGVPHAVRTLNFLPIFQVFTAIGIATVLLKVSSIKYQVLSIVRLKNLLFAFCFLLFAFNLFYYLNQYFVQQNYFNSQDWQYGYKETVDEVRKMESKYSKIIISNKPYLDQSYMFFLFYLRYPPSTYQQEIKSSSGGFKENHYFGKFEFRPIDWSQEEKSKSNLYVGRPSDFDGSVKVLKTINFLDGKPAIKIVER